MRFAILGILVLGALAGCVTEDSPTGGGTTQTSPSELPQDDSWFVHLYVQHDWFGRGELYWTIYEQAPWKQHDMGPTILDVGMDHFERRVSGDSELIEVDAQAYRGWKTNGEAFSSARSIRVDNPTGADVYLEYNPHEGTIRQVDSPPQPWNGSWNLVLDFASGNHHGDGGKEVSVTLESDLDGELYSGTATLGETVLDFSDLTPVEDHLDSEITLNWRCDDCATYGWVREVDMNFITPRLPSVSMEVQPSTTGTPLFTTTGAWYVWFYDK